jgi:predicted nucleic acid-binding protein
MRRKRIEQAVAERFLEKLTSLNLLIEPALSTQHAKTALLLSIQHSLTFYDAAYLELAQRKLFPLGNSGQ